MHFAERIHFTELIDNKGFTPQGFQLQLSNLIGHFCSPVVQNVTNYERNKIA